MAGKKKKHKQKRYFDEHVGLYFREEFIEGLKQSAKQERIVIDDLDAWFKERYGV